MLHDTWVEIIDKANSRSMRGSGVKQIFLGLTN
jgi:hypothetical protein